MKIHFYLRFHTRYGQSLYVSGNANILGNDKVEDAFPLTYFNDELWHGIIDLHGEADHAVINYKYILAEEDGTKIAEGEKDRVIDLTQKHVKEILVIDTWNHAGNIENAFYTQPFTKVLSTPYYKVKDKALKNITHQFRVKAPLLYANETVCLTGSSESLKEWDTKKPLLLNTDGNWFTIKLNLKKDKFPVEYKYGIYNTKEKKIENLETGNNRILHGDFAKKQYNIIHDGFVQVFRRWKGAGVAIPVFSLRSKNSFGVGEFNDIKLLVDWAKQTGLKLVQLLPVNDTTATHTWMDSYPYAAISAFALHPLYINLETVAASKHSTIINALTKKQKQLNELTEFNYEEVMKLKLSVLKEIYSAEKENFHNDIDYFKFFDLNRNWLVPYACFCFLRDRYKTADFTKWKTNKIYNEDAIQKLASPTQKYYDEIAFHYFVQYHLHLQMKNAVDYAHKQSVILKGDIPIGIYRYGCDAWMAPELYNMNEQAGAPPDDFAVKGQNWGFPTYNWKKMQEDGFTWWRNRFEQMSEYFDAFRIDHILGFFRIWSIPLHAVEGILGRFVPAISVHINEFHQNGIWFQKQRYCKPFITDDILQGTFSEQTEFVKENFLYASGDGAYQLKEQFNTQQKIEAHFQTLSIENANAIKEGLFNLISNVILIEEEGSHPDSYQQQQFHFRIAMDKTSSFQHLDAHTRHQLKELYINYFFHRQDYFWKKEGLQKLPELKSSTNMLVCGEDLGMVPHCVPEVMDQLGILSLEIQRMPKLAATEFFHPRNAPYLSVVTPSTHDMSTIRGWWEEDRGKTQRFYNYIMGHYGQAPFYCEPWVNREIIVQHIYSPAMWSIFQIQDLLGMSEKLRRENPAEERINQPADPKHYWRYRMHINLEALLKENEFNAELKLKIKESGR